MRLAPLLGIAAVFAASPALAEETNSFSLGPSISSLGIGAEAGYRLNDNFGFRGGANYFQWSGSRKIEDIDYDVDLTLASGGLVADYYPFSGGFRLSGGARINGNKVDLKATPGASVQVDVGGSTYTGAELGRLDGDVKFNRIAPYIGLGYEANVSKSFSISFDAGALWQGKPKVGLRANPGAGVPPADAARISADVERERQDIEDDLKAFQFYPVLSITAKYRF